MRRDESRESRDERAAVFSRRCSAFTLIELLTVIAIIALLAALITWGTTAAGSRKVETRVKTELAGLELALEDYHKKYGFYPPSNSNDVALPPLYYELTGTEPSNAAKPYFKVDGIMNSEKKNFMRELKSGAYEVMPPGSDDTVRALIVPYKGPSSPNTWRYNSVNPVHNPETYDLWAEVIVGGRTNVIGNWKE
jgi:prepilin-type N-terminal cleavage/methylation domain-containing protein